MVFRFTQEKHTLLRDILCFARIFCIEPSLKEARIILSLEYAQAWRIYLFSVLPIWAHAQIIFRLRYTLRFAKIHGIEPRLREARMILSLGSNRLELQEYACVFQLFLFVPRLKWLLSSRKKKHSAALYHTFCKDWSHWGSAQRTPNNFEPRLK